MFAYPPRERQFAASVSKDSWQVGRGLRATKPGQTPGQVPVRTIANGFAIALRVDFTGVTTRRGLDGAVQDDSLACVCGCVGESPGGSSRNPGRQG